MSATRAEGVRSGVVQCGQGRCGNCRAQRTRPQDEQRGVCSDNACIRATMVYTVVDLETKENMKAEIENKRGRRTLAETSLMIYRVTSTQHRRGLSSFDFGLLVRGGREEETI